MSDLNPDIKVMFTLIVFQNWLPGWAKFSQVLWWVYFTMFSQIGW